MLKSFKELKKKYVITAAILCAVIGISFGLLAVGAVLLALKLCGIYIHAGFYALIGIGGAILVGVGIFFAIFPKDSRVAKRLDEDYGLKERVRTALAFIEYDGDMVRAQKQDAEEHLASLKLKKPPLKKILALIVVFVLALALFVTAIAIPAKKVGDDSSTQVGPPVIDDSYALSEIQKAAIEGLISDVGQCSLDDVTKGRISAALSTLLDELEEANKIGQMQTAVLKCLRETDSSVKAVCSYFELGSALITAESKELALALAYGAENYKFYSFPSKTELDNFYNERKNNTEIAITATIDDIKELFKGYFGEEAEETLQDYCDRVRMALRGVTSDSVLKGYIETFEQTLEVAMDADSATFAVDALALSLANELAEQSYVLAVSKFVQSVVLTYFKIPTELIDFAPWNLLGAVDTGGDDQNDEEHGGGYGEGGQTYGSNDEVYDPLTGQYVPYGELIQKYYSIVQSLLDEGTLSEEQASAVRDYFTMLFGGIKE